MILNIKYFGRIVELTNSEGEQFEMEEVMNLIEFKSWLVERYPSMHAESFQIAVDQELKSADYRIEQDCELAILPPFAGG